MTSISLKRKIRPFTGDDESEVVALWNKCLIRDQITTETFRRKILLDDNFDQNGCLVAELRGKIVGFSLAIRRRYPYYGIGLESEKGWITSLFVHPEYRNQGIGKTLLSLSEEFLSTCGAREVYISPYTPNYFIPGVDIDAYREGYEMLKKAGYKKHEKVYSMGRSLLDFDYSQEIEEVCSSLNLRGIEIKLFEPRYIASLIAFISENYPGDLLRVALEQLRKDTNTDQIIIAVKDGNVIGFSHYEDEHFGPFAIHPAYSGIGIGTCLYYKTALYMKKKGKRNLWLGWTSGHAKDFYYHRGLKVLRRHEILKKILS